MQSCPTSEGGHNWHAMSYNPGINALIIPVAQSCQEMNAQKIDLKEGGGSAGEKPPGASTSRRLEGQRRKTGGLRRRDTEGTLGHPAAGALHDGGAVNRERHCICGETWTDFRAST